MSMVSNLFNISGLTNEQVLEARKKFGQNVFTFKKENNFFNALIKLITDPMMILLLVASSIYFISGKQGDGIFLLVAILFQSSISLFQYQRSKNALEKLKSFTNPKCKVIRNGKLQEIVSNELVIGDSLWVEEGAAIAADGVIIHSNDFSVNESVLTGESLAAFKDKLAKDNYIYSGTTVTTGLAIASITAIGNQTKLGKIGISIASIVEEKTPLEIQIQKFVTKMAIVGIIVFVIVWAFNFWQTHSFLQSLLQSLTIAMSILPEEIPVAFTTFMALGAWRLMKMGIVVKQMKTVETLGSATVICTDKTGTLTENKMSLAKVFNFNAHAYFNPTNELNTSEVDLLRIAMFASEPIPFDPLEIALHHHYGKQVKVDERPRFKMAKEYPLNGTPPMMTHIFEDESGKRIIAAKGAPEALMKVSKLSKEDEKLIEDAIGLLAAEGYRLLGFASAEFSGGEFPATQQEFAFNFKGILAFYDPPKENISQVLTDFYNAGIQVKIITGDNAETTISIAKQIGFKGYENTITGEELMKLKEEELKICVQKTSIFTRMFPEAKLKIINALKANQQIVAMTGDGVNDGPALKAAHIGIAMGKKGTEIAKQAASLILLEDDLSKMVEAVAMGRKIYTNLKKAIQYIISIHIPIILVVFIPLAFGWLYPNILSPIHIIFLEIIMGPTCSIIYENEPIEKNLMLQKPKPMSVTFFNWKELSISIVQGLAITAGVLFIYQYALAQNYTETLIRTMVFTSLILANVFLTLVNRSFYYSIFTTLQYKNPMVPFIVVLTITLLALLLYVEPLTRFFHFESLGSTQLLICSLTSFTAVMWFELAKYIKRRVY